MDLPRTRTAGERVGSLTKKAPDLRRPGLARTAAGAGRRAGGPNRKEEAAAAAEEGRRGERERVDSLR